MKINNIYEGEIMTLYLLAEIQPITPIKLQIITILSEGVQEDYSVHVSHQNHNDLI